MQMSDEEKCCLFFQVPDVSLLFPTALRYAKRTVFLQAETGGEAQNKKRKYNNIRLWDILSLRTQIGQD